MTPNARFRRCLEVVLAHEGGYSNHPADRGGPTNHGITLRTLAEWRGVDPADLSAEAVASLSREEAEAIYLARFWNPIRGDELPPGLDLAVLDYAVNSGVRRAARALQGVVGASVDGVIGQKTLAAVRRADAPRTIDALCDQRLAFLRGLDTWGVFGRGWTRRVEDVRGKALAWARETMPLREVAQTDTAKAATTTAAIIAATAAALQEVRPVVDAAWPWLDRYGAYGALAVVACATVAGVYAWRARRV